MTKDIPVSKTKPNIEKRKLQVGDTVRLSGKKKKTAKIISFVDEDLSGVLLDKALSQFRYWNVNELVLVEATDKEINK